MGDAFWSQPESAGSLLGPTVREQVVVPIFQRGYAWSVNDVDDFWRDIGRFRIRKPLKGSADAYFLGPIVTLLKKDENVILLLDGQQRLATATILFSVIRDLANEISDKFGLRDATELALLTQRQYIEKPSGVFALQLGETDKIFFSETIQRSKPLNVPPKIPSQRKIKAAREKLLIEVRSVIAGKSEIDAVAELQSLQQTLLSDVVMARIRVDSIREAFQIFETLNARGVDLSASDLLLNYLMGYADESDHRFIRDLWNDIIERIGHRDIDKFLRHMWVSEHGDLKGENLFTALSAHIEEKETKSIDYVGRCWEECESYIQLMTVDEAFLHESVVPYVKALVVELGATAAYPLLLSSYIKLDKEDFLKVVRWLLVFVTRYAIIANLNRAGMETVLFNLAAEVRAMSGTQAGSVPSADKEGEAARKKSRDIANHIREVLESKAPDTDKMKEMVRDLVFQTTKEAKYFLNRIARYMQDPTSAVAPNEVNLEHIYPQSPEENEWGGKANQEKLNPLIWHIGNLTIYGKRANKKVANKEYAIKRPKYAESLVTITSEVANNYDDWNDETIRHRGLKMAKLAGGIWNFENASAV